MKGKAIDSFLHILNQTLISRLTDSVHDFFIPYQLYQVSLILLSYILTKQRYKGLLTLSSTIFSQKNIWILTAPLFYMDKITLSSFTDSILQILG